MSLLGNHLKTLIQRSIFSWNKRNKLFTKQSIRLIGGTKMSVQLGMEIPQSQNFIFRQLFDSNSCTYTYLLGDVENRECILIDPVLEHVDRDLQIINDLELTLKYAMNTHVHADHISGSGILKRKSNCATIISKLSCARADKYVEPGNEIKFGKFTLSVRGTPGHTSGCVTYVCEDQGIAFTGDALLIRGCGRTDFQNGDPGQLYESVHKQIFSLPDNFKLYPAHDYKGFPYTTVLEERNLNPRLANKTKEEFIEIMENLKLDLPKKIDVAVPANLMCGIQD